MNDAFPLRWLYLDLNSYFASVEQQLDASLRGRPVIVVPVETDSTCAIAASYEAKAYGIKTGTPVWEAKRKCPHLVCVLARHDAYVTYHQRIVDEVNTHLPVTMVCSIDEVACRLMDNERDPQTARAIALRIKRGIADNVGPWLRSSIGIAPNRYLAKVATDLEKPDGLTVLEAGDLPGRLFELSLRDLPGIGRGMETRLRRASIYDMPALWALAPRQMRHVWGSIGGERMWYGLRGYDLEPEATTRRSIGHSHVLAPELRDPVEARFVARRLALKAASRLRRMDYVAGAMALSARIEGGPRWAGEARARRARDNPLMLSMLETLWEAMVAETGAARFKKISITLYDLMPLADCQADLFDTVGQEIARRQGRNVSLSLAMDRLNQRYGRDTVLIGMLPTHGRTFSGTKIAFTRIPDLEEFSE